MKKLITLAAVLALGSVAQAQTLVSGNITTSTTWSGEIVLANTVFVTGNATLTISAGTIVRGQPRTAAVAAGVVAGSPGALIVTQTGRIVANGTSTNPIIFTTAAIDNNDDGIPDRTGAFLTAWSAGSTFFDDAPKTAPLAPLAKDGNANVSLWGGLVILGNAPTNNANKAGVGYGKATVEGLTVPGYPAALATYGGILPHDNSGSITFASIRHAGDEIGNSNELNGLTLAGVGDGTRIENVEVYCNFDDGIEWFGGTVNGKNLVVVFAGDDSFDVDEGYTGSNQFLFSVMPFFNENDAGSFGSASGDKLGEFDGDNYRPDNTALDNNLNVRMDVTTLVLDSTPWPLCLPQVWNLTGIGSTPTVPSGSLNFTVTSAASTNRGIQVRNGGAGAVFNSVIVCTGSETGFEISADTSGAPGFNTTQNVAAGFATFSANTFVSTAALGAAETPASTAGNTLASRLGATGTNQVNPTSYNGLIQRDPTFDPTGNATGKLNASLKPTKLNPRTASGSGTNTGNGVVPQGPSLDRSATYRGAFPASATKLWTTGWTALNIGGIMVD